MSGFSRQLLAVGAVFAPAVALVETIGVSAGVVWVMFWLISYLMWGLMGHRRWSMRP